MFQQSACVNLLFCATEVNNLRTGKCIQTLEPIWPGALRGSLCVRPAIFSSAENTTFPLFTLSITKKIYFLRVLLARISSEDLSAAIASLSPAPLSRPGGKYLLVAQIWQSFWQSFWLASSVKIMIFVFFYAWWWAWVNINWHWPSRRASKGTEHLASFNPELHLIQKALAAWHTGKLSSGLSLSHWVLLWSSPLVEKALHCQVGFAYMMRIIACLKFDTSFGKKKERGLFLLYRGGGDKKKQGVPLKKHTRHPLSSFGGPDWGSPPWCSSTSVPSSHLFTSIWFLELSPLPVKRLLWLWALPAERIQMTAEGVIWTLWHLSHDKSTPDCQKGFEWEEVWAAYFGQTIVTIEESCVVDTLWWRLDRCLFGKTLRSLWFLRYFFLLLGRKGKGGWGVGGRSGVRRWGVGWQHLSCWILEAVPPLGCAPGLDGKMECLWNVQSAAVRLNLMNSDMMMWPTHMSSDLFSEEGDITLSRAVDIPVPRAENCGAVYLYWQENNNLEAQMDGFPNPLTLSHLSIRKEQEVSGRWLNEPFQISSCEYSPVTTVKTSYWCNGQHWPCIPTPWLNSCQNQPLPKKVLLWQNREISFVATMFTALSH